MWNDYYKIAPGSEILIHESTPGGGASPLVRIPSKDTTYACGYLYVRALRTCVRLILRLVFFDAGMRSNVCLVYPNVRDCQSSVD